MTDTVRLTKRGVPENVIETIAKAAELQGMTFNAFIVNAALTRSIDILDEHDMHNIESLSSMSSLKLSEKDSLWFLEQLSIHKEPNEGLKESLRLYNETVKVG